MRHGAGRNCAKLPGFQRFHADGAAVEAHELHLVGGALSVHMHDHAHVTRLQAERGQRGHQHDLGVFLEHRQLLHGLRPGKP